MKTAKGMKVNKVAYGSGAPYASDGSGSNKPAKALSNNDIGKGQHVRKGMHRNDGHSSPVGKSRPTQNGGPRSGQTSGVDFNISGRTTAKDWAITSKRV